MTIWINEQIDPCGLVCACIASKNEQAAQDCYKSWQENLTEEQLQQGWQAILRTVDSWDEVPVNALKIN
jgi:hypothetical protein